MKKVNKPKVLKKPPIWKRPVSVEIEYQKIMLDMSRKIKLEIKKLINIYPDLLKESGYKKDSWQDSLNGAVVNFTDNVDKITNGVFPEITGVANDTSNFNLDEWERQVKTVMGIDLFVYESWLKDYIDNFVVQNITLIKNMTHNTTTQVRRVLSDGIINQERVQTISKRLTQETDLEPLEFGTKTSVYKALKNRANLIAINEVSNFNGMLMEKRQTEIGIKTYIWRNVKDRRVRGNPAGLYPNSKYNHWSRDGKRFAWHSSSGRYASGVNPPPQDGNPARPVRCRCYAEPCFSDVLGGDTVDNSLKKENELTKKTTNTIKNKKEFENDVRHNNYETLGLFDAKTNKKLYTLKGGKSSVIFDSKTMDIIKENDSIVLSHNHPVGSSFSFADLNILFKCKSIKEVRAVGKYADYSVKLENNITTIKETLHKKIQTDFTNINNDLQTKYTKILTAKKNDSGKSYKELEDYINQIRYVHTHETMKKLAKKNDFIVYKRTTRKGFENYGKEVK